MLCIYAPKPDCIQVSKDTTDEAVSSELQQHAALGSAFSIWHTSGLLAVFE
jgi:hypothetical protein